ncbi:FAD/NAD(P)-binding protein [Pedosphaera parvula]|uniref:FAD dependent oxidoreductase n=1 Tax=Pedosphaera parvula (strain Ellin514) TaxID=320771 RepID=B9XDW5_PEDPL|nr:FAD/NAD(P)-binding protein [Pedosphaera parvula]EEF61856.1 FAD dependent oxidoreductase [Pedosphaera parvula Ellin514]
MKSIVIIGGGFSGTTTAINLARLSATPLQITIVSNNRLPCRGIAYSTRNSSHLLNVVARNMSALADQPNHFVEWLSTRSEYLDEPLPKLREKFVPRKVYGDYLHCLFQWYFGTFAEEKKMKLETVHDEARDILIKDQRAKVILTGGRVVSADKVVLAVGNQAPADFRLRGLDVRSLKYIGNPWIGWETRLPSSDQDVLLIGTGLTMVDTFLTLRDLGWKGKIFAVSRNGLLPLSHFKGFDYPELLDDENATIEFRKIFSIFKQHYRTTLNSNLNPAILVDKLRPFTQRIWQNFSVFEKKQFNRRFRTQWNVMRHRIAPEIHRQLREAITQKQLEVIKGRLCECVESKEKMKIRVEGKHAKRVIEVGAVINCTGPQESYVPSESKLFKNLFFHGLVQPDEMNMGIKVAPSFSVIDRGGNTSEILFAMGALLKGTLWESTAVPELRTQAFRIAETIAERSHSSEIVEDVLEYSI